MGFEKWLAIASLGLFVMFVGEMISIYNFMLNVPDDFEFAQVFSADPKILQFISIGAAPAGILAAVAFILSRQYGSKPIGGMIVASGIILAVGMYVCYSLVGNIEPQYISSAVTYVPILFMALSAPVVAVGVYLIKHKKIRPKKEYF